MYPLFLLVFLYAGAPSLRASDCSTPVDPNHDFFYNFATNPCYIVSLPLGQFTPSSDLNALYSLMPYKVDPNYQLILVGTFSNSRFMEIQGDDEHSYPTSAILDHDLTPLLSTMINPFVAGTVFVPNQHFAVSVIMGDTTPAAVPGCNVTNEYLNTLDVRLIHQTGPTFVGHETGPSAGGTIMVRRYLNIGTVVQDAIMVRRTDNGCAIPITQAYSEGILLPQAKTNPNIDQAQVNDHYYFGSTPQYCFTPSTDPASLATGRRHGQYIPDPDVFGMAYVGWQFSTSEIQSVIASSQFLQFQFNAPTTPLTPCAGGCSRSGSEQLRYFSLTFQDGQRSLASPYDTTFNRDALGNVTLVVNVTPGLAEPANVANSPYTYLDLTKVPGWAGNLSQVSLRNVLPLSSYNCSTQNVPPQLSEWNPAGGYMGTHGITVGHFRGYQFPVTPTIPPRSDTSCSAIPPIPTVCPATPPPAQ